MVIGPSLDTLSGVFEAAMGGDISPGEIVSRFQTILNSFNFAEEWRILGIGRFHVFKRKTARLELHALYVALWNLALEKSLPEESQAILALFMEQAPGLFRFSKKEARLFVMRADVYMTFLSEFKDSNFSEIASQCLGSILPSAQTDKARILRLSLHIRKIYTLIFNKLL